MSALSRGLGSAFLLAVVSPSWGATCSVSAVSLAFGHYDSLRATHTDSSGNVAVTCNGKPGELVAYTLALNTGAGTFAQRHMRSAAGSTLHYNIYTDTARNLVWGDGNGGSVFVSDSFRLGSPTVTRNHTVYGRTFRGQKTPVGTYSDSIVVTLSF